MKAILHILCTMEGWVSSILNSCLIEKQKDQDSEPRILMTWDHPLEVNTNNSAGWPLASDGLFVVCLSFIPGWMMKCDPGIA